MEHTQLVAVTPSELPIAQREVGEWCQRKIIALSKELREQRENMRQAKKLKWKHSGWLTAANKTKKRMVYYTKLKLAIQHGYLIIPNFNVDVIAVRVQRTVPSEAVGTFVTKAELLPPGVGRYVDNKLAGYKETHSLKRHDGTTERTTEFHPMSYSAELDFPATLVKPVILAETNRAMALRVFDRIGIVRESRKSDPIVVGQIINPTTPTSSVRLHPTCVSFFIAWWLDTQDL